MYINIGHNDRGGEIMSGKIFVRERRKVSEKEKKPRFAVVAVSDVDLKIKVKHIRKQEIEEIAGYLDAEIVYLTAGNNDCED